jgi:hypothetical protein
VTLGNGFREILDAERERMSAADVFEIGSMLSYDERVLLHWAARTAPPGAIVDLGAFLGGSALALATGGEERGATVYSYDKFVLAGDWERAWLPEGTELELGHSTIPVFDANVARVRDQVVARQGDVEAHPWTDGPIGALFIDIAKSWDTGDYVWRTFLPALVPGSLVIQQDLVHWGHPWCAIIMEYLSESFEYLGWVWYSSAVYRCIEPITTIPTRLRDELSCDELVELVDRAAARIGEPAAASVRMSAVEVYGTFNRFDDARACVQRVRDNYDDERLPHIEEGCDLLDRWIADVESGRIVIDGR